MGIRLTSWNVNGLRNPFSYQPWRDNRSFAAMFDILEADIVILQETKIQRKDLRDDMVLVPGWDCYFSLPKHEKGKFGVVIYTRQSVCAPSKAEEGITGLLGPPNSQMSFKDLPDEMRIGGYPTVDQALRAPETSDMSTEFLALDSEGRCVILEFPAFVLIGVYNPAIRDESRDAFRIAFLNLLDIRIRNLVAEGKRVILAGDLNVVKNEMDMANCQASLRKSGVTTEEYFSRPARRLFNHLVDDGVIWGNRDEGREKEILRDLCRYFHPSRKGMFTCWETKINARPGNYGSRIDYVLCSQDMIDWFSSADIQEGLMGSDHCPVFAIIKNKVCVGGKEVHIHDIMNPAGMFKSGKRIREYSTKDLQALSGRLIPEFSGRRNIRDMFKRGAKSPNGPKSLDHINKNDYSRSEQSDTNKYRVVSRQNFDEKTECLLGSSDSSKTDKKRSSVISSPQKNSKRLRSEPSTGSATGKKGQQNLMDFLVSKSQPKSATSDDRQAPGRKDTSSDVVPLQNLSDYTDIGSATDLSLTCSQDEYVSMQKSSKSTKSMPLEPIEFAELERQIIDTERSKESWSKLFAKPPAPLCEGHSESCKIMTTKKPGLNFGRSFWMCAKPLGPSGQKETGSQWRCGTFIWCSDWGSAT